MIELFKHWSKSLQLFSSKNIGSFLIGFITNFFKAIGFLFRYFWWVILIDFFWFIYLGDLLLKIPQLLSDPTKTVNGSAALLQLLTSILWFIISTALLLSIRLRQGFAGQVRRGATGFGYAYFKTGFFRYVQLALAFSLTFFILINFLVGFGITIFPKFHWSLIILIRFIEILIIFFWLDSSFRLKEILYSLEKALNLFLYNIPFFAILFSLWWLFKWGLSFAVKLLGLTFDFSQILSGVSKSQLMPVATSASFNFFSALKILGAKYMFFFGDYLIIALIFAFYALKKDESYTSSLFDKNSK